MFSAADELLLKVKDAFGDVPGACEAVEKLERLASSKLAWRFLVSEGFLESSEKSIRVWFGFNWSSCSTICPLEARLYVGAGARRRIAL